MTTAIQLNEIHPLMLAAFFAPFIIAIVAGAIDFIIRKFF